MICSFIMMRTLLLFISIGYFGIMTRIVAFEALDTLQPAWYEDLSNYIQQKSDTYRQVILITSGTLEEASENQWIRRILHTTTVTYPTIRIEANFSSDVDLSGKLWSFHQTDATATLFIFIDNLGPPRLTAQKRMTSFMKDLSLNKKSVTYLIIFLASEQTHNFDELLKHGWKRKITDLVILEVVKCQRDVRTILKACVDDGSSPVIHYYNPFLNSTIRKTYEAGIEWFPDVMSNMHGYELKIGIHHEIPFTYVIWDENDTCEYTEGSDISMIKTLAEKMNFTIKILPRTLNRTRLINSASTFFEFLNTEEIDIYATSSPHHTGFIWEDSYRSRAFSSNEFCAVIPILKVPRLLFPKTVIASLILTIGIVLIFFALTWLFRFHQSWSVFSLVRVLFGIPVHANHLNLKLQQRLLVKILMIVSLFYSAKIYGSLTNMSIGVDQEVDFENFYELDRSGLIPMITPSMWNRTFDNIDRHDRALINLKNKTIQEMDTSECLSNARIFKNVTCLLGKEESVSIINWSYLEGKPTLKLSKTCFWSDNNAFLMANDSLYRERIDRIINRIAETGLLKMWIRNDTGVQVEHKERKNDVWVEFGGQPESVLHKQLVAVLLFGFIVATVTFIGELLWYHGNKRWKKIHLMDWLRKQ